MAFLLGPTIAAHAARAGFRDKDLTIAVAVAGATSLGNENHAGGLWGLPGVPGGDPAGNAVKAYERWRAGGWAQWSGYTSGRYLLFMPGAQASVKSAQVLEIINKGAEQAKENVETAIGAATTVVDAAQDAVAIGVKAGAWLSKRENWIRIAEVVIGGAMVIVSLTMIANPERALGGAVGMIARPIVKGVAGAAKGKK